MVQFYLLPFPPPPRQPRGQVQAFGPGGGELLEAVSSLGEGGEVKYVTYWLTPERVEKTAYFQ